MKLYFICIASLILRGKSSVENCDTCDGSNVTQEKHVVETSADNILTVSGRPCKGDDCKSTAKCPRGTSIVKCTSKPENDGDGISIEGNTCVAWTGPAAVAKCS
eukprot:TRINITY_DN5038_c0_g1_i13.p5 TRINITY_DN5038_c0_g1~~TRINITY_DN5038_c0_g1_i13.p5  ORF type:complete len:104 (-),score=15.55 TRINITY_DN5038_c0_g1_i13:936-1247(-)